MDRQFELHSADNPIGAKFSLIDFSCRPQRWDFFEEQRDDFSVEPTSTVRVISRNLRNDLIWTEAADNKLNGGSASSCVQLVSAKVIGYGLLIV